MKKILIPTDFSKASKNATKCAVELFRSAPNKNEITFVLYHALHIPEYPSAGVRVAIDISKTLKETKINLKKEREYWKKEYPAFQFESQFSMERIESNIGSFTDEEQIDMVIVGSLDISGFERWLMDTSALDIAKNAEVPVMVIPEDSHFNTLNKVVFAADFNNLNILSTLNPIKQMMDIIGFDLTLLQIAQDSDSSPGQNSAMKLFISHYIDDDKISFDHIKANDVVTELDEYFNDHNSDLMIIFDRDRNFFESLFSSDLTKKMIWQASMPLLIMHEEDFSDNPEVFDFLNKEIREQIASWQNSFAEIKDNLMEKQQGIKEQWKTKASKMIDNIKDMEKTLLNIENKDEEKWEQLYKDLKTNMKDVREKISQLI